MIFGGWWQVRLLGADGLLMSSITSGDAFMVKASAERFSLTMNESIAGEEAWQECSDCIQVTSPAQSSK